MEKFSQPADENRHVLLPNLAYVAQSPASIQNLQGEGRDIKKF